MTKNKMKIFTFIAAVLLTIMFTGMVSATETNDTNNPMTDTQITTPQEAPAPTVDTQDNINAETQKTIVKNNEKNTKTDDENDNTKPEGKDPEKIDIIITYNGLNITLNQPIPYTPTKPVILNGTLMLDTIPVEEQPIDIITSDFVLGTTTTDKNGIFSLTLEPNAQITEDLTLTIGNYTITAKTVEGDFPDFESDPVILRIINDTPKLKLSQPTKAFPTSEPMIINGTFTLGEVGIPGQEIELTTQDHYIGKTTTDENGTYSYLIPPNTYITPEMQLTTGTYTISAKTRYEPYPDIESNDITITLIDDPPILRLNQPTKPFVVTEPITINGTLILELTDTPIEDHEIELSTLGHYLGKTTTDENGTYKFTIQPNTYITPETLLTTGTYTITAKTIEGRYSNLESDITITIIDGSPILTINQPTKPFAITEPITIYGSLRDTNTDQSIQGQKIEISTQDHYLGTTTTDENETFKITIQPNTYITPEIPLTIGDYTIKAKTIDGKYPNLESDEITITIIHDTPILTLKQPTKPFIATEPITINGTLILSQSDIPIQGQKIELSTLGYYIGNTTTDENGAFTCSLDINTTQLEDIITIGNYTIKARTLDGKYPNIESNNITIIVNHPTNITLNEIYLFKQGELTKITGQLTNYKDHPIANARIDLLYGGVIDKQTTTDNDGNFTFEIRINDVGTYSYKVNYTGYEYYINTSENFEIIVRSEPTLTLDEIEDSVYWGKEIYITGKLVDNMGNGITNELITLYVNREPIDEFITTSSEEGEEGTFTYPLTLNHPGVYIINATFEENGYYKSSTSNVIVVTVKSKTHTEYEIINDIEGKVALIFYVYDENDNILDDLNVDLSGDITENNVSTVRVYKNSELKAGNYAVTVKFNGNELYLANETEITLPIVQNQAKQIEELNSTVNQLHNTVTNQQNIINELNTTIKELNNTINQNSTMKELNTIINQLNNTINNKQNIIDKLNTTNEELNNTINQLNNTINQLNNSINNLTQQLTNANKEIETLNKIIEELTKPPLNTTTTINQIKSTVGSIVNLSVRVKDQNGENVNDGKVIFKVNGITLKDERGNVLYATPTDGVATLKYKVQGVWMKNTSYVEAVYEGNENYSSSKTKSENALNISEGLAKISLEKSSFTAKSGETITLRAKIVDSNGDLIKHGKVVFKLNGKTITDKNGKALQINVVNGEAIMDYTIPSIYSAKTYTLTAVYGGEGYKRSETTGKLVLTKKGAIINTDSITTTNGKTTVKATITDETGKLLVRNTKLAIKVNGKTILKGVNSTNGKINLSFVTTLRPGMYELQIISGENGIYKTGRMTTVLRI